MTGTCVPFIYKERAVHICCGFFYRLSEKKEMRMI